MEWKEEMKEKMREGREKGEVRGGVEKRQCGKMIQMSWGLKVGTVNIQGGYNKKKELLGEEFSKFGLDILALCDIGYAGKLLEGVREESIGREGHRVLLSGIKRGRQNWGVGMILGSGIEKRLLEVAYVSERIMWARFSLKNMICRVVVVYAPCNGTRAADMDAFYSVLEGVVLGSGGDKLIIMGDFNGWIGSDNRGFENIMGKWGDDKPVNGNGKRLLDFCLGFGLVITNSVFPHKMVHKYTWEDKKAGSSKSIIDYVLVSADIRKFVLDTRVYRGFEFGVGESSNGGSDHYLVCSSLRVKWERVRVTKAKCKRIKIEGLSSISIRNKFKEVVATEYSRKRVEQVQKVFN